MQTLATARGVGERPAQENPPDAAAVDAVLTASRSLIGVATRSLDVAEEETTITQYRALVVLASHGPHRMVDLAEALAAFADAAGEVPDRQWPAPGPAGEAAAAGMGKP